MIYIGSGFCASSVGTAWGPTIDEERRLASGGYQIVEAGSTGGGLLGGIIGAIAGGPLGFVVGALAGNALIPPSPTVIAKGGSTKGAA